MNPASWTALGQLRRPGSWRNSNGIIVLDGDPGDTNGLAIDMQPGGAAGNERAGAQFGDFFIGQDTAKNGTKNFGILDAAGNLIVSGTAGAPGVGGLAVNGFLTSLFGAGAGVVAEEGNINRQISAAGVQPGATGVDSVLAVYSLPANSFDVTGRGICITAQGSFGATANNKRIKIIVNPATAVVGSTVGAGGTTVSDTGVVATNGGGWGLQAQVFKYGAGGANTQIGLHQQAQIGAAVAAMLAPSLITAVENAAILIAITGNATTAATDIVFNFLQVTAMN